MARIYPSSNKMAHPVAETKGKKPPENTRAALQPEHIMKMTKAQLTLLASKYGVDITACKTNEKRADLVIAAMKQAPQF